MPRIPDIVIGALLALLVVVVGAAATGRIERDAPASRFGRNLRAVAEGGETVRARGA